ncbi:uncharacterized protein TNCV_1019111 [Trichonephila clavipes]|nr:uncharacterized protein TNCV_1019111 [Trichonephila clavipes]
MIPAYNKMRCAAFPFETGIPYRRKTDFFPEEDTTKSYTGFEPQPTWDVLKHEATEPGPRTSATMGALTRPRISLKKITIRIISTVRCSFRYLLQKLETPNDMSTGYMVLFIRVFDYVGYVLSTFIGHKGVLHLCRSPDLMRIVIVRSSNNISEESDNELFMDRSGFCKNRTVLEAKREEFVDDTLIYANILCEELEISFEPPRRIRRKHIFGDGRKDVQLSYEDDLRRTFSSIDGVTAEIRERFQQLQNLAQKYAF